MIPWASSGLASALLAASLLTAALQEAPADPAPGDTQAVELTDLDISVVRSTSGAILHAHFRAVARRAGDVLVLDYCGPALLLMSVDGSTVDISQEARTIRAELHRPLRPGEPLSFRILATVPTEPDLPAANVRELAAQLLCR